MADIEPYKQIQKTNVQEHNDLVAKINEIIEVINQTNLETVVPKISELEQDVSSINATDSLQWNDIESIKTDIETITPKIEKLEQDVTTINGVDALQSNDIKSIKDKNTEQDNTLATHTTEIDGITKSRVSDVVLMNGTTVGNMKVRIERESAPSIDSDDYNIQKPTSVELVQGTSPSMMKAQITLSDGTVLVSDDFMFTTEAIGTDVYISSFVFKNGNVAGTISADIGLSNGSTLTANNFAVPTDPNVTSAISDIQGKVTTVENDVSGLKTTVSGHTTSINGLDSEVSDLQTRITAVEGGTIVGLNELKQTVDGHTASISALDSDVANLQIDKADVSSVDTLRNTVNGKVNIAQGSGNAGKVLGINASGNVEPITVESGGEVWEEIDLNNFPNDWVAGDRVKVEFYYPSSISDGPTSWSSEMASFTPINYKKSSHLFEIIVPEDDNSMDRALYIAQNGAKCVFCGTIYVRGYQAWNQTALYFMQFKCIGFNGAGTLSTANTIKVGNFDNTISKMYRLKK